MIFRWSTRILFIDTDASGRIHYTAMFRYFEAAEIEFFRAVGILRGMPGLSFPRVHVECDYSGAIFYDDELHFQLTVGRIGNTSMQLKYRVFKDNLEVARGNVVIAVMDKESQRATPMPAEMRSRLQPYAA